MKTECLNTELSLLFILFKFGNKAILEMDRIYLRDSHFANVEHREIFSSLSEHVRKNGLISLNAFAIKYKSDNALDNKGILKLKQCLIRVKEYPSKVEDVPILVKGLIKLYCVRQYLNDMNNNLDKIDTEFEDILARDEKAISILRRELNPDAVQMVMGLRDSFNDRYALATEIKNNPNKAGMCEIGLINLDNHIGRQAPGDFVIFQARTGIGKSMFLMNTAVHNYRKGRRGIVITIEMSSSQYLFRMDSKLTGIEHKEFASGEITESQELSKKWKDKVDQICGHKDDLLVYWVPSNCTPAKVRSIIANNPFKPDFVIMDYAGDMKSGVKGLNDYDSASHGVIYSSLKEFAGEFNLVMYSAQQTKRGVKKIDSESGSWSDVASNKADIMIAIEITKEDEDFMVEHNGIIYNGRMTLSITKGRNIPKCKTQIIPTFNKMHFIEKEFEEMLAVGFSSSKTQKQINKENIAELDKEVEETNPISNRVINNNDDELNLLD